MKKNEIVSFTAAWVDIEAIMLSEMSDKDKQASYYSIYMWNLKLKIKEQTTQKQTQREPTSGFQKGDGYRDEWHR